MNYDELASVKSVQGNVMSIYFEKKTEVSNKFAQ